MLYMGVRLSKGLIRVPKAVGLGGLCSFQQSFKQVSKSSWSDRGLGGWG